jgi:hypothetical protein
MLKAKFNGTVSHRAGLVSGDPFAQRKRYKVTGDPGAAAQANRIAMAQKAQQQNQMARNLIIDRAIEMTQSVNSQTFAGGAVGQVVGTVINVQPRYVGMVKRFICEVTGSITQGAAETQTQTKLGISCLFSQVIFTDLANQTRINTTGWHLHLLATVRRQAAFGAAFQNDSPVALNANFPVISAPAAVTGVKTFRMFYEIPITYGDFDFRGGIYLGVVNATANIQYTVNPNFFVAAGAVATQAAYQSSSAQLGILSALTVNTYQQYLDQIPQSNNGPILPMLDLSTAYLLNNTQILGLSANQDIPAPYANFRNFMSTIAIYDNAGVLNAGTDIAYWALQSANYTNIFKLDPYIVSLFTRETIGNDTPPGTYYFNHRSKPISTIQYGNMQLVINASAVTGATSQVLIGYEALAQINQIVAAGSIYGT